MGRGVEGGSAVPLEWAARWAGWKRAREPGG